MNKAPKKPTGELNLQKVTGDSVIEIKTTFPETKPEIEAAIANLFVEIHNRAPKTQEVIDSIIQNHTDDLDFTISQGGESVYLEMMEVLPKRDMRGGYEMVSPEVDQGQLVDHLISKIYGKSTKYSSIREPIDLLLYLTDNNSRPSITAENYIKSYLNSHPHCFRRVYLFVPFISINDGIRFDLFPSSAPPVLPPKPGVALNLGISRIDRGSNYTPPKTKRRKRRR